MAMFVSSCFGLIDDCGTKMENIYEYLFGIVSHFSSFPSTFSINSSRVSLLPHLPLLPQFFGLKSEEQYECDGETQGLIPVVMLKVDLERRMPVEVWTASAGWTAFCALEPLLRLNPVLNQVSFSE